MISADEAVTLEPALRHIRPQLAGATYTAEDESGDANLFARELVKRCEADGVQFLLSHTVTTLREAGAGDSEQPQFWTGLRPATPSNVPIIGRSKLPNLFLNTGHGTLGWTHSCGSGKSMRAHRQRAQARGRIRIHRQMNRHGPRPCAWGGLSAIRRCSTLRSSRRAPNRP